MATDAQLRRHQKEVARLLRQLHVVNKSAVGDVIVAVKAARIELVDEMQRIILRHGSSSIEAARIRELLDATDLVTARLNARLRQGIGQHVQGMMKLGSERLPDQLAATGLRIELPGLDPLQVQFAQQYSMSLVQGVSASARQQLHGVMFRAAMGQQTPWEAQLEIRRVLETEPSRLHYGSVVSQAERIYRTEGLRAANLSHGERIKQSSAMMPGATKMWMHGGGGKDPRPHHRAMNGKAIPVDEDFVLVDKQGRKYKAFGPHDSRLPASEVVNCLLPDTIVSGRYLYALESWYSGPVREIETGSGHRFSVTLNHPVLTPSGFVNAGNLREGDDLLCDLPHDEDRRSVLRDVNDQDAPTTVKDVFETFRANGRCRANMVTGLDLHGDAKGRGAKIDVVAANRELLLKFEAEFPNRITEVVDVPLLSPHEMSSHGPLFKLCDPSPSSPHGVVGGPKHEVVSLRGSGPALPFGKLDLSHAAPLDPPGFEEPPNHRARNSEPPRDHVLRLAGKVRIDHIARIRDFEFSGHVYDLQSEDGLIVADHVLLANCTCTLALIPAGGAEYDRAIGNSLADKERARIAQDWQRALEADLGIARDAQNLEYYDV